MANPYAPINGVETDPVFGVTAGTRPPTAEEVSKAEPDKKWKFWAGEISAAQKVEERWRKEAEAAESRYYGAEQAILNAHASGEVINDDTHLAHSTIDTVRPVLYSQPPQPIVRRRFGGEGEKDPVDKYVAEVAQRVAQYLIDRTDYDYTMQQARDDWTVPGRGMARVVYEATFGEKQELDPQTGQMVSSPTIESETVYPIYWPWRDVLISPASSWQAVRWIAYRHYMAYEDAEERFGEEIATQLAYPVSAQGPEEPAKGGDENQWSDAENEGKPLNGDTRPRAVVWEIWHRKTRKVMWWSAGYSAGFLKEEEDPYDNEDFWDCPRPLLASTKGETMTPRPDLAYYAQHIDSIDLATKKLNGVLRALNVVGFYPGNQNALLDRALEGDRSKPKMVAVPDMAAFEKGGGMRTFVQWFPIEQFVAAAQQFMLLIEQKKQQLFEISGVSDIMRGQGDPNETATAQRIKGRYAGLRTAEKQRRMALFCRDTIRIMIEMAVEHMDETTIAGITQIDLPWTEQERQLRSAMIPGPDGQPAPVDPSFEDKGASWETVMQRLRSDLMRAYSVSIETDSTILEDEQEDREARVQFLTAFAGFAQTLAPMVQSGMMDMASIKALLLFGIRGFRKARMLEYMIEDLPDEAPQQNQGPSPEEVQIELAKIKGEIDKELQAAKLGQDSVEREKDRKHEFAMKGIDLKAEAARAEDEAAREDEVDGREHEREETKQGRTDAQTDMQRREEFAEREKDRAASKEAA
jgi:hypothetical protein